MAKESRAFGSQRSKKQHLLLGKGGVAGEVADLRKDVEEGFQNAEGRANFPELDFVDGTLPAAAGGDFTLVGRNLLQGQTFDALTVEQGAASVVLTALTPGDSELVVEVTEGAGVLAVSVLGKKITIELASGGSTDDAIATAINADGADTDGLVSAESAGGGSIDAAQAEAPLVDGVGDYDGNVVMVAGKACLPANTTGATGAAAWTDTQIDVTAPALAPAVATDTAQLSVASDGTSVQAMSVVLG